MATALNNVGIFLISIFFSLVLLLLWLRASLSFFRISRVHPVSQSILRLSDPFLKQAKTSRYDWLCLGAIVVLTFIKLLLLSSLAFSRMIPIPWLLILVVADIIEQACNLFFYALLIRVLLQWINPDWARHQAASFIMLITEPLIRLCRPITPKLGHFDLAPLIAIVILRVISIVINSLLPVSLL